MLKNCKTSCLLEKTVVSEYKKLAFANVKNFIKQALTRLNLKKFALTGKVVTSRPSVTEKIEFITNQAIR